MLHKSWLVRQIKDDVVQCRVCEHFCTLKPDEWGKCGVRVNREGAIYSTVYGQAIATHIDPIEKKPLFHFLPGSPALSIGTYGCNMRCRWCQNWHISQTRERDSQRDPGDILPPDGLVESCLRRDIPCIAYTYNEPTVFFEYTYDTAKLAHGQGITNVYVSNGFMSQEALEAIVPYLDGINVDLKGFSDDLYRTYTDARLAPVKRNIAYIAKDTDVWIEVTTLLIPGLNDSNEELRALATWLAEISPDLPWHVTAFYPTYQMQDRPRTAPSTLQRAHQIGKDAGLRFVYVGNILDPDRENTYCPQCHTLLIKRWGYRTHTYWKVPGTCPTCGTVIPGRWM
ncbi:MAG: AmmeMemoRadiSam system radical SAM enzyme [Anaerolineae bacterium]